MINKFTLRRIIQIGVLIFSAAVVIKALDFIAHSYCPYALICFGARGLRLGSWPIFLPAIIAGFLIALITIFIGRRFCGYICPLGTLVEYLNLLNPFRKRFLPKRIPLMIERRLRLGKYLILIATLTMALLFWGYLYYQLCPVMLLTFSAELTLWGILVLLFVIIGSIFINRFWCRYLCPYAAILNCFQFIGKKTDLKRSKIYRNLEVCNDCRCCELNCQMNIEITEQEYIEDFNCIYCLNCIKACPKEACLTLTDKMK
jgi:polyferredoxin